MEILIPQNFKNHLKNKRATMAAIGPMSKNYVEATIEIANDCGLMTHLCSITIRISYP